MTQQPDTVLRQLLPGTVYEQALNVEQIVPTIRVDKVFKVLYHGKEYILHLEFQTSYDNGLKERLATYNLLLYQEHHLPVITIVVYPFKTTVAKSPLLIMGSNKPIVLFEFETISLFELDAQEVVAQRQTLMYPLLPMMQNVSADLMEQVALELSEFYTDDQGALRERFLWTDLFLKRTTTIPDGVKKLIRGRLSMYDERFFEETPTGRDLREIFRQVGRDEVSQEYLGAFRNILVSVVKARYPDMAELAEQRANQFDNTDDLQLFILQAINAPNERIMRKILKAPSQRH